MSRDEEKKLRATLEKLDTTVQKILATRGYSKESKTVQILQEMIREQLTNANTRSSTRTIR